MAQLLTPAGYKPLLDLQQTELAIKKVKVIKYIVLISIFIFFITFVFVKCHNIPQKRIGDTDFYLMTTDGSDISYVYYKWEKPQGDFYEGVNKYQVHDIYWDSKFLLLECYKKDNKLQPQDTVYYIIEQNVPSVTNGTPWSIREFESKQEFYDAMVNLGISKFNMKHMANSLSK